MRILDQDGDKILERVLIMLTLKKLMYWPVSSIQSIRILATTYM